MANETLTFRTESKKNETILVQLSELIDLGKIGV